MNKRWRVSTLLALLTVFGLNVPVFAASSLKVTVPSTPSTVSTLVLLTGIVLIPVAIMTLTAFPKIVIVLSMLSNAIGLQGIPPTPILVGLGLALTGFVMMPVVHLLQTTVWVPYIHHHLPLGKAILLAQGPLSHFMEGQTRPTDLAYFAKLDHLRPPLHHIPFLVLWPAFLISQLTMAFEMGLMIYIPFIAIDMIVASVLMSLGMIMVPPTLVSLPLKLLVFVLAGGWLLIVQSLITSFH